MRNSLMAFALAGLASLTLLAADPAPSATPGTPVAPLAVATVHMKNFAYVPRAISIKPGDSVRFVNDDDVAHSVTASDKSFDSSDFDRGQSWVYTFKKAGTFLYFCADHPMMKGSVTVGAAPSATPA